MGFSNFTIENRVIPYAQPYTQETTSETNLGPFEKGYPFLKECQD